MSSIKKSGWVKNPTTGRMIKKGGPTWTRINRPRYKTNMKAGSGLKVGKPPTVKASLKAVRARAKSGRDYLVRRGEKLVKNVKEKKGAKTRGWALDVPRGNKERGEVLKECGSNCFLAKPGSKDKKLGFPICRRCIGGKCDCEIDLRGLQAAYQRAIQWGHMGIAAKAADLKQELKGKTKQVKKAVAKKTKK